MTAKEYKDTFREPRKAARDPVVIATEKAYRASNQYALDKLLRLRKRYKTRLALAQKGIDKTQREIENFYAGLCSGRMGDKR